MIFPYLSVLLSLWLVVGFPSQCFGDVFKVETTYIGSLKTMMLSNTVTGEYTAIISDFGGRVEELVLLAQKNGKLRNVLLTHNKNETAITENSWWKGMILLPWANRIAKGRYKFFNDTYQLNCNENTTNPDRLNALHGLLAGKVLAVEAAKGDNNSATLVLSYSFNGDEPGYPFKLTARIEYQLSNDGLAIHISVTNNMLNTPLPFYVGWHPYFACKAYKAVVTFDRHVSPAEWVHVEMNSNLNPTGITDIFKGFDGKSPIGGTLSNPTFYDDEYKQIVPNISSPEIQTHLYDPDDDQTVTLWQDYKFRFVHIFTGSASLFQENAVAMEPMSGMADSYNNHDHLAILSGGERWDAQMGVFVT